MPGSLTPILVLTLATSLFGLVGGFVLLWREATARRWSAFLVSFAAGSLLGASFFNLLPEALATGGTTVILGYSLLGILAFFLVEKFLVWHHHSHVHDIQADVSHPSHLPSPTAVRPLIVIGDALHNFLDGAVIAIAFLIEPRLGLITALAVVAHELPQEIGDFGILLHAGMARGRVLFWNLLGALVSPLGALVGFLAAEQFGSVESPLLAFAAGTFVYIALADLFPTIQHESRLSRSAVQLGLILLGLILVWRLGQWLPA